MTSSPGNHIAMATSIRGASVAALLLVLSAAAAGAARSQAVFAGRVNLIAIYVTVVGDGNALITNLAAEDFEVRDDGQPRKITQFEKGSLPITMAAMLDDSPSLRQSQPSPRAAIAALVKKLRPADRATIGFFNRTVRLEGGLTGDRGELLERLSTAPAVLSGTALWDAINAGMSVLEGEPGRRVVLALTDGDDNSSETGAEAVTAQAIRDGLMIYAIGVRGAQGRLGRTLSSLSRETGGWFFELKPDDNLETTFARVADELHAQYLLGFRIDSLDGRVHQLSVKVKRRGAVARARRSYVASRAPASPDAASASRLTR